MATRIDEVPKFPLGNSPLWHVFFVVLWGIWAALTVNEYVGDAFGLPAFLLALLCGVLFGVALFGWLARTKRGRKARQLYADAPLGQQLVIGVVLLVPLLALMYGLSTVGVSAVLAQVALVGAIVGYHQSKFASAYARLQ
ncbi:hypothetical protein [Halococcus agarilyticus]|uniref:hypothetical protein n=1 Tax=Halococcus agarilyticus TaxID=1232219 RepID=UPI0012ABF61D|nr:hypothetical protein [Halococcus agarilyticus]